MARQTRNDAWNELEAYLGRLLRRLVGDGYQLLDPKGVRLPFVESVQLIEEFAAAKRSLWSKFDRGFLQGPRRRRHFNPHPKNCFVAEPLLTTHLLIVVFTEKFERGGPPDPAEVAGTLDGAHATLVKLVRALPPDDDDDGDRPPAAAQRLQAS